MVPPLASSELVALRAAFDRDHVRLLELLADTRFLCERQSFHAAAKVFAEFRMLQEQHLAKEEALLERLQVSGRIPRAIGLKATGEHAALRDRIGRTWDAVTHNDCAEFEREMAALSGAINAHEEGEKEELLPALASAISDPETVAREVHQLTDS